ncbi:hypothetical protein CVT26_006574 [Gymnopilus dilepis]|uniref:Uncharacterized protein n=1 Tax=Gymnopilus dilepis TaxID=231916 RepID=A0A409Y2X2_9AGAR|nr:hypothetical protein CVT26_006574 [Gymnopilus dilepis]
MVFNVKLFSVVAVALGISTPFVRGTALPTAAVIEARKSDLSPSAQVCTGSATTGCITVTISSDSCINFTGGLSFLNKEVSTAVIPDGFVCTFFEQFGCESAQGGEDTVVLQGGTWDFFEVPGVASTVDFNDLSSSFQCSPV